MVKGGKPLLQNYTKFCVSLSIHYFKNMYSGIGSGVPLCLGPFEAGLSDKVVETVTDHSLLLIFHHCH
jgi:hypothetical protein